MILWTKTRMVYSETGLVLPSQLSVLQAGMAMVAVVSGGIIQLQPSQGANSGIGTKLEGIAMDPPRTSNQTLTGVTVTAPTGGGIVSLPNTVLSNSDVGVFNAAGTQITTATSGSTSTTTVVVTTDGTTGLTDINFDPSMAGEVFNVFYNYALSPLVQDALFGDFPGFFGSDVLGEVGIFKIGRIALNNFDPMANWYSGTNDPGVKVVAGGLFTDTGSSAAGFVPPNVDIVQFPTPAFPWLTIDIH
jgi:hypothetical protein